MLDSQLFHYSITPLLHYSITPLLHYSITPLLHYSITPLLHSSITPLLHYSITPLLQSFACRAGTDPLEETFYESFSGDHRFHLKPPARREQLGSPRADEPGSVDSRRAGHRTTR